MGYAIYILSCMLLGYAIYIFDSCMRVCIDVLGDFHVYVNACSVCSACCFIPLPMIPDMVDAAMALFVPRSSGCNNGFLYSHDLVDCSNRLNSCC